MAKFELTPVLNVNTGTYEITNYEDVLASVRKFIAENHFETINNDLEYGDVKEIRKDIRKKKELITNARLQINELLLGTFNKEAKELEDLLEEEDKHLKSIKEKWEVEMNNKVARPKMIKVIAKTYDMETAMKIKNYALMLGAEIEVK